MGELARTPSRTSPRTSAGTPTAAGDGATATSALLWAACHRQVPSAAVHEALASGADVDRAAAAAVQHGIAALLWRSLEEAGALDALGAVREELRELVELQRLRALLLVPETLALAVGPLADAGLEPVVLKGPAVARRYPAPGLRLFEDIDLLLPRHQHAAALAALGRAGWQLARGAARDRYDHVLRHPSAPDMPLELHYGLEARYDRASALRAEDMWESRQPCEVHGSGAWVLAPAEELVMLCAHAAKPYHCFRRLMWVADLAMVLGHDAVSGDGTDWEAVARLARRGRCTTAVGAALALATRAGAAVPEGVFPLPAAGWRATALSQLVDVRWPLTEEVPIHLRFALADGTRRRLALLAGYTHGYPAVRSLGWHARSVGFLVRRWRALHAPVPAGGGPT